MTSSRPIVVGTDGSPHAERAVEWAAAEAARRARPLHVLHAVPPWDPGLTLTPDPWAAETLAEAGERILGHAVELAVKTADVEVTTEQVYATPVAALRERAGEAAEVVVGHRGLGGFKGLLLGSTSLKLAGRTPCPVVIVRGENGADRREVLVGVDPRDEAHPRVLHHAFRHAVARGSRVRVLHTWEVPPTLFDSAYPAAIRQALAAAQERLAEAVAPWRVRFPDVKVVEEARPGHPADRLVEASARAELLVVGAHRHGHGGRIGSVGHGVIHHADCPVAIVGATT
jgi:nucleotide-binding universal stress UspA family protein